MTALLERTHYAVHACERAPAGVWAAACVYTLSLRGELSVGSLSILCFCEWSAFSLCSRRKSVCVCTHVST